MIGGPFEAIVAIGAFASQPAINRFRAVNKRKEQTPALELAHMLAFMSVRLRETDIIAGNDNVPHRHRNHAAHRMKPEQQAPLRNDHLPPDSLIVSANTMPITVIGMGQR